MANKIFTGFIILFLSALLWLIPISGLIYSFRTDVTVNEFYSPTAAGIDNVTVTLSKAIYDGDTSTLEIMSNLYTDTPALVSYNGTSRATLVNGLTDNATRTLTFSYDTDALNSSTWDTILDLFPKLWMILIILFPIVGLTAIIIERFTFRR